MKTGLAAREQQYLEGKRQGRGFPSDRWNRVLQGRSSYGVPANAKSEGVSMPDSAGVSEGPGL